MSPRLDDLIGMALAGEVELGDLDLEPGEVATLRAEAATVRRACDIVSAALATAWEDRWPGGEYVGEDGSWARVAPGSAGWKVVDPDGFARWLADAGADTIRQVVGAPRVGTLDPAVRDTFLERTPGRPALQVGAVDGLPPRARARYERLGPGLHGLESTLSDQGESDDGDGPQDL